MQPTNPPPQPRQRLPRPPAWWTPLHTTAALALLVIILGILPIFKMGLIVNGVFLGGIIALGAIGLSLVFGILNFANVAHGDFMITGAYVSFFIIDAFLPLLGIEGQGLGPFTFGYPLLIALPFGAAAGGAAGHGHRQPHLPPLAPTRRQRPHPGHDLPWPGHRHPRLGANPVGNAGVKLPPRIPARSFYCRWTSASPPTTSLSPPPPSRWSPPFTCC